MAPLAQVIEIKSFYVGITRLKTAKLRFVKKGMIFVDDEIPTSDLLNILKSGEWDDRALAAKILKNRKEIRVPDALIQSIISDKRLDVLKESITSFSAITEYKSNDVLDHRRIVTWWEANRDIVLEKL